MLLISAVRKVYKSRHLANSPFFNAQLAYLVLNWSIILLGIALRFKQYDADRSLWLDELFFAVNFLERDWTGLVQLPLDYSSSHVAPPGFLLLTFALVNIFGLTEPVLRFLPLVCGIGSLFLFERLVRAILTTAARPIALFLFAVSDSLIFFSAEFKQYSCDVFIILALMLWFVSLNTQLNRGILLQLACIGALLVWFSHPVAFVLAAIGLCLGYRSIRRQEWRLLLELIAVAVFWLLSFILMFYFVGGAVKDSDIGRWLVAFWYTQEGFIPDLGIEGWHWLGRWFFAILHYPGDLEHPKIITLLVCFGFVALFLKKQQSLLFIFITPVVMAIIASYLEKYPVTDRLVLFVMPALYIILAEGISCFRFNLGTFSGKFGQKNLLVSAFNIFLPIIILIHVVQFPIYATRYLEEIKPVLAYLKQNKQPEDTFYIYHFAEPALRFYGASYGLDYKKCVLINTIPQLEYIKEIDFYRKNKNKPVVAFEHQNCILGVSEYLDFANADVEKLRGHGRVWLVFSHLPAEELMRAVAYLDTIGSRLDQIIKTGSSAYLYKL